MTDITWNDVSTIPNNRAILVITAKGLTRACKTAKDDNGIICKGPDMYGPMRIRCRSSNNVVMWAVKWREIPGQKYYE